MPVEESDSHRRAFSAGSKPLGSTGAKEEKTGAAGIEKLDNRLIRRSVGLERNGDGLSVKVFAGVVDGKG